MARAFGTRSTRAATISPDYPPSFSPPFRTIRAVCSARFTIRAVRPSVYQRALPTTAHLLLLPSLLLSVLPSVLPARFLFVLKCSCSVLGVCTYSHALAGPAVLREKHLFPMCTPTTPHDRELYRRFGDARGKGRRLHADSSGEAAPSLLHGAALDSFMNLSMAMTRAMEEAPKKQRGVHLQRQRRAAAPFSGRVPKQPWPPLPPRWHVTTQQVCERSPKSPPPAAPPLAEAAP